ncbi:hypothetical protein AB4144_29180, partial [Rhizobiaceae sp. 2RAB30]
GQIIDRLTQLAPAGASVGLDSALRQAKVFATGTERLDATAEYHRKAFAEGKGNEEAARLINGCFKRLSRLLVPLQSTAIGTYGHDPYGYTPQTTMIPCLYDVPKLATLKDGEDRWMLETGLVRSRNRVADTLSDSLRLIEDLHARLDVK